MRKLFALFSFWLFSLVSVVEANAIESSPMLGGPSQTVAVLYITSVAGTATIIGHILYNEAGVAQTVSATNCGTHLIAPRTCSVIFSATVGAYWAVVTSAGVIRATLELRDLNGNVLGRLELR